MVWHTPLAQARKKSPPSSRYELGNALPSFRLARTAARPVSLDSTLRSMVILLVATAPPPGPLVELLFGSPQAGNSATSAANPSIRWHMLFVCIVRPPVAHVHPHGKAKQSPGASSGFQYRWLRGSLPAS